MTISEMLARAVAYEEAAEHLLQTWTDDRTERLQGNIVSESLQKTAEYWYARALKHTTKAISKALGPLPDTGSKPTI